MLRSYVLENHRAWEKHLPEMGYAKSSIENDVTNISPNFIVFSADIHQTCAKDTFDHDIVLLTFKNEVQN